VFDVAGVGAVLWKKALENELLKCGEMRLKCGANEQK
jgi:hypothetical protein